jgi:hypothetical protein
MVNLLKCPVAKRESLRTYFLKQINAYLCVPQKVSVKKILILLMLKYNVNIYKYIPTLISYFKLENLLYCFSFDQGLLEISIINCNGLVRMFTHKCKHVSCLKSYSVQCTKLRLRHQKTILFCPSLRYL